MRQWCIGNWSFPSFRLAHFLILISCTKSECSRKQVQFIYRAATDLLRAWGIIGRFWYKKNCSKIISWAGSIGLKNCVGVVALVHRRCDSSVGRALDWRSKGPVFDPRLRHCFLVVSSSLTSEDFLLIDMFPLAKIDIPRAFNTRRVDSNIHTAVFKVGGESHTAWWREDQAPST